uniref:Uncharacterized protein n=1 Tax=Romanomermis culicivorax TaxID=13658 RepID=A0A915J7I6_ROMCU
MHNKADLSPAHPGGPPGPSLTPNKAESKITEIPSASTIFTKLSHSPNCLSPIVVDPLSTNPFAAERSFHSKNPLSTSLNYQMTRDATNEKSTAEKPANRPFYGGTAIQKQQ